MRHMLPADLTPHAVNEFLAQGFPGAAEGGSRCMELGEHWALVRNRPGPSAIRPGDIISGPTLFSIADAAMWFATFTVARRIEPMALTSELSIRFLRPAKGTEVWGRADIDHPGRRSVIGTVRMWTDDPDRPVAVAQSTYVRPIESR